MTPFVLSVSALKMAFEQRTLFEIEHLELHPKEAVYLHGQNGVGKTTLLKILAGLQQPTAGQLNLNKANFFQKISGFSGQSEVIYMHQTPYLFDTSVKNNILYGLRGMNRQIKHHRLEFALETLDLKSLNHKHISELSGGEKQKVAMARAWVKHPAVLLMDEASTNLDMFGIQAQRYLVEDLLKKGCSLVITSHSPNPMTQCCHYHWTLENRQLTESDHSSQL